MVNTARVATMVVGELCHVGDSNSPQSVTELWILDSVQQHILLPFLDLVDTILLAFLLLRA